MKKQLEMVDYLDPCSKTGMKIFLGHQKNFLTDHCHFAEGSSEEVIIARVSLFGKIYRLMWNRVLKSKSWENEQSFLRFMDFFIEYITEDEKLVKLIDDEKWFISEEIEEDAFFNMRALMKIGEDVVEYVMANYFAENEQTSNGLVLA